MSTLTSLPPGEQQTACLVPDGVTADELDSVRGQQVGDLCAHPAAKRRQRAALRTDDEQGHAKDLALAEPRRGLQRQLIQGQRVAVATGDDKRDAAVMTRVRLAQHLLKPGGVTSALERHGSTDRRHRARPGRDDELIVGLGRAGMQREHAFVGIDGRERVADQLRTGIGRDSTERITVLATFLKRGQHLVRAHYELRVWGDQRQPGAIACPGLEREQQFDGCRTSAGDNHARSRSHAVMLRVLPTDNGAPTGDADYAVCRTARPEGSEAQIVVPSVELVISR